MCKYTTDTMVTVTYIRYVYMYMAVILLSATFTAAAEIQQGLGVQLPGKAPALPFLLPMGACGCFRNPTKKMKQKEACFFSENWIFFVHLGLFFCTVVSRASHRRKAPVFPTLAAT